MLITVSNDDKPIAAQLAKRFHELGFKLISTGGTAKYLRAAGVPVETVLKVHEGRPHGVDLILNGDVQLLVNTPLGKHAQVDDERLRQAAISNRVPYTTTLSAASAACEAIAARQSRELEVRPLQEWHQLLDVHRGLPPRPMPSVVPVPA